MLPLGDKKCAMVSFTAQPLSCSKTCWTEPLPKVLSPTKIAESLSFKAPANISEELADNLFTSNTVGMPTKGLLLKVLQDKIISL